MIKFHLSGIWILFIDINLLIIRHEDVSSLFNVQRSGGRSFFPSLLDFSIDLNFPPTSPNHSTSGLDFLLSLNLGTLAGVPSFLMAIFKMKCLSLA